MPELSSLIPRMDDGLHHDGLGIKPLHPADSLSLTSVGFEKPLIGLKTQYILLGYRGENLNASFRITV